MEFDRRIKVLCFSNENVVKGLKWAFDQKVFSDFRYEFYAGSLAAPPENLEEFDLFALTLDLGQPVPVENLRKLPVRLGLAAFLQPTPQQLLSLGELPEWNPIAWDGVSYDKLASRLDFLTLRRRDQLKVGHFLETCSLWIDHHLALAGRLDWVNAPETYAGLKSFRLERNARSLSLGAQSSRADVKLPVAGGAEYCEFRFHNGRWSVKVFDATEGTVTFEGNPGDVRPGDRLTVNGLAIQVKVDVEVESFLGVARKSTLFDAKFRQRVSFEDKTLADICREFLSSWTTGELRVGSGLKHGSIFFKEGTLTHAVAGAVSGLKALTRMFAWEEPTWRFNADKKPDLGTRDLAIGFMEFSTVYRNWREHWGRLRTFSPPSNLRLRGVVRPFNQKVSWTNAEYQVMSAVCEFKLIRDVFNNCALLDVEILSALVDMRRQGLVEPVVAGQTAKG